MNDETILAILKWFGVADAAAILAAIALIAIWSGIAYAMKISRFTPLFIKWRYEEWEKQRDRITTTNEPQEPDHG